MRYGGFFNWLVVLLMVLDALIVVLNSLLGIPTAVLMCVLATCLRMTAATHIRGGYLDPSDIRQDDLFIVTHGF